MNAGEPGLPLPTEPYTVIRVAWRDVTGLVSDDPVLTLRPEREFEWVGANDAYHNLTNNDITSFEVLSRPVKAVADVREHAESEGEDPDHEPLGLAKIGAKWGLA